LEHLGKHRRRNTRRSTRFDEIDSYRKFGTFKKTKRSAVELEIAEAEVTVDGLIYLIGLIVVIMAILSFFGLR
jgi:hypothetical protein